MSDFKYLTLAGTIYIAAAIGSKSPMLGNAIGLSLIIGSLIAHLCGWIA